MAAVFLGEKTLKQQSIEQALRRLKYLHTSLSPHEAGNNKRSQQKVGQFLRTKPLQPAAGDERVITIPQRTTAKEQCFLSLEPKTVKRSREKEKARVKLEKQRKKAVRTGRALLHSKTYEIAAPKTEEGKQFKTRDVKTSRTPTGRVQSSKSAPESSCTVDPYKCVRCFTSDFEHSNKKQRTKQYYTNIKINRVTFSARPIGSVAKSTRKKQSKVEVPKSGFSNGWGMRCKTESLCRGNRANDSKCSDRNILDVTAGLKTVKLETWTERMRKDRYGERLSQSPFTPVRQIAIRLPQGRVVKYQLSEDE